MDSGGGDFYVLPEGCVANVLSFAEPCDVARLSMVSSTFRSAADSDAVWERFLPPEYQSIISASSDSSLLDCSPSKKDLYLRLCNNPILIDGGKKSFSLDKWSGKKRFMISARDLMIVWGDTPRYWRWTSELESRFEQVAELIGVCWLEIRGKINVHMLSTETLYGVYFVYKTTAGAYGFENQPVEMIVGLAGTEGSRRSVYLDTERGRQQRYQITVRQPVGFFIHSRAVGVQAAVRNRERNGNFNNGNNNNGEERKNGNGPQQREDGWLEIEVGEFFNKKCEDGDLEMSILEVDGGHWKGGLIVQGIEIRPKVKERREKREGKGSLFHKRSNE